MGRIGGVVLVVGMMGASGVLAWAQEGMPGMTMPGAPAAGKPAGDERAKKASGGAANKAPNAGASTIPAAPDTGAMGKDGGNARAKAAAASEQDSEAQQAVQAGVRAGSGSDQRSMTLPVMGMQEPEAQGFRTGGDLPAPELLGDVVGRPAITLESFLTLADQANPTMREAQRNVDRSVEQGRQAGLPPDPTVGYSAEHVRGGSYHGGEEGAFLSQTFVLGRKLALRREVYRAEGRTNAFAAEAQRARVHNDVASAFVDALTAQAEVTVRDRMLRSAMDAAMNAHEMERTGQVDATGVLTAEIAEEQAKVEFTEAQRMFLGGYARLAAFAGQGHMEVHPLVGALVAPPEMDATAMGVRDVRESPEVKRAEAGVAMAEARLRSAKREAVPDLTVKAGEWYSGEVLAGTAGAKAGWMGFAEAGVQVPLWNRNQGNMAAARAEVDRARHEVTRTELWTRKETEPMAEEYMSARFAAERYRTEMLPRARRAYELEVMKYQQMAEPYGPALVAENMVFTLQMGYLHALARQWHAAISLSNFALRNGLDEPMFAGEDRTTGNLPTAAGKD